MTEKKKEIPESIKKKILELKKIETILGHLPIETWTVNELQKKTDDPAFQQSAVQLEAQTEILFAEICDELIEHKFNHTEIVTAINSNLCYQGGIKYCNEIEVREALGID